MFTLQDKIYYIVDCIDESSFFAIVGQYIKGDISEKSSNEGKEKVDSGDVDYNIVLIGRTKKSILYDDVNNRMKFDFGLVHQLYG